MESRAATYIDYTTTPGSERTAFFDAPIMTWNKKSSETLPATADRKTPVPDDRELPGAFVEDAPEEKGKGVVEKEQEDVSGGNSPGGSAFVEHIDDGKSTATNLSRKPSVAIGMPRDAVVRKAPADGDEEGAEDVEDSRSKGSHGRSSSVAVTDSGYGSGTNNARPQSRASRASDGIEPIPILWTDSPRAMRHRSMPAVDDDGAARDSSFKRASSLRSFRSAAPRTSVADVDRGSIRTTPSGAERSTLRRRRISLSGGSFASGAGTVGPAASPAFDDAFHDRSRSAEMALTDKQKVKLTKAQSKSCFACSELDLI